MFHLGVLHNKNSWRATSVNLNRKGSSHTSVGLIRKQKVGLQEMSCYTSGHKRRECIITEEGKTREQQAISLEAADAGILCFPTFLPINTLVEGFGPHWPRRHRVSTVLMLHPWSLQHNAASLERYTEPTVPPRHPLLIPTFLCGPQKREIAIVCGERACKNQRWVTKRQKNPTKKQNYAASTCFRQGGEKSKGRWWWNNTTIFLSFRQQK